jgi:histidine triad (HIT) family protein
MLRHEPSAYACPFCRISRGAEAEAVVYNDGQVIGVVSLHQKAGNQGHLLVMPAVHFENLYETPDAVVAQLFAVSQRLATVLKHAMGADGITLVQNNEPAGGQDVWHLHVHVIPRFDGDGHAQKPASVMPLESRARLAEKMRAFL